MSEVKIKEINYLSFGKCIEISNNEIDVVITLDFGPRIIRYGFIGEENMFCDNIDITLSTEYGEWKMIGGHRLWHSPERIPRTYIAEDKPVKCEKITNGVHVTSEVEQWVQIQKEIEVTLSPTSSEVKIVQKLTNKNAWPVELSAWSITAMDAGGKEIIPLSRENTGLLPNRSIILWPYTRINDERVKWLDQYVIIDAKQTKDEVFKLGINNKDGWAAYLNKGCLFIKRYEHCEGKTYPDYGSSYETYTNGKLIEMEILSPYEKLEVVASVELKETWELKKGIKLAEINDENIDKFVKDNI